VGQRSNDVVRVGDTVDEVRGERLSAAEDAQLRDVFSRAQVSRRALGELVLAPRYQEESALGTAGAVEVWTCPPCSVLTLAP
jgi:hypothetical protein